ncbi:MAG: hypothetical protein ABI231_01510 [Candidatus Tumulicola sp.]
MKHVCGIVGIVVASVMIAIPVVSSAESTLNYSVNNRYGGPSYDGQPALAVTAALVEAGGGVGKFSIVAALTQMVGSSLADAEVAKLTKQYGKALVAKWITGFNFSVEDSLRVATKAGITLPESSKDLQGKKLAEALVTAGVDPKTNVFWAGLLYDNAVSHKIHDHVMNDIDAKYGEATDMATHRISNQAMYDLAHALGDGSVKLATLH